MCAVKAEQQVVYIVTAKSEAVKGAVSVRCQVTTVQDIGTV